MGSDSRYLHGVDDEEQRRLGWINDLLNEAALRELGLQAGERVLEVGAGTGVFAAAMAEAVGAAGRVLGIERDAQQLAVARVREREGLSFREGDAAELPLHDREWGGFDLAHARFLLEHLPDPVRAIRSMVRALRPGGRLVLADDDHSVLRVTPEPPGFRALWEAYQRAFEVLGNDPRIGRRLVALLVEAGARPVRNTALFFGACQGDPRFPVAAENLQGILHGARGTMLEHGLVTPAGFEQAMAGLTRWATRPDAALWYSVDWAEGRRADEESGREV